MKHIIILFLIILSHISFAQTVTDEPIYKSSKVYVGSCIDDDSTYYTHQLYYMNLFNKNVYFIMLSDAVDKEQSVYIMLGEIDKVVEFYKLLLSSYNEKVDYAYSLGDNIEDVMIIGTLSDDYITIRSPGMLKTVLSTLTKEQIDLLFNSIVLE